VSSLAGHRPHIRRNAEINVSSAPNHQPRTVKPGGGDIALGSFGREEHTGHSLPCLMCDANLNLIAEKYRVASNGVECENNGPHVTASRRGKTPQWAFVSSSISFLYPFYNHSYSCLDDTLTLISWFSFFISLTPPFPSPLPPCFLLPGKSFAGGPQLTPPMSADTKYLCTRTQRTIQTGGSIENSHLRPYVWVLYPTYSTHLLGTVANHRPSDPCR